MTDQTDNNSPQSFAEEFWDSLGTGGKPVPVKEIAKRALERPVTLEDIEHMVNMFPYLDICNADLSSLPSIEIKPKILTAQTHWVIHDRGERLTAGPGRLSFGGYHFYTSEEEAATGGEGGEGGGQWVIPEGTTVKQFYDTAVELISIAKQRWPAVEIIGGHRSMQRAAWMAGQELGIAVNYGPTAEDMMIYGNIKRHGGIFGASSSDQRGRGTPRPSGK